jgi:hypothetical protein
MSITYVTIGLFAIERAHKPMFFVLSSTVIHLSDEIFPVRHTQDFFRGEDSVEPRFVKLLNGVMKPMSVSAFSDVILIRFVNCADINGCTSVGYKNIKSVNHTEDSIGGASERH